MTMVLPRYQPNFDALSAEQASLLAAKMELPDRDPLTGHDLYEVANQLHMDQADVVMTIASDPTLLGVATIEALIGKPIVRRTPPGHAPRQRGAQRRGVSVHRSDTRKISYVADNPKKSGSASYDRFAKYGVGITVDEFVSRGGTMGDVKWDAERGFIRFEGDEQ